MYTLIATTRWPSVATNGSPFDQLATPSAPGTSSVVGKRGASGPSRRREIRSPRLGRDVPEHGVGFPQNEVAVLQDRDLAVGVLGEHRRGAPAALHPPYRVAQDGALQEFITGRPVTYRGQNLVNLSMFTAALGCFIYLVYDPGNTLVFAAMIALALIIGVFMVLPIGGADMPVVVSLLNSYAGLAASATGFAIGSNVLIVCGAVAVLML